MTTPDVRGLGEDLGIVEVYGASISTFTRTITLALHHLGLPFLFKHHMPHSAEIRTHNPLGLVPVLIHRPNALYAPKRSTVLYESNAIRRYVDDALFLIARQRHAHAQAQGQAHTPAEHAAVLTPPLDTGDSQRLLGTAAQRAAVDQVVSLASTTLFTALEARLIKPRQAMEQNGADDATVSVAVEEALDDAQRVLGLLEGFLASDAAGGSRQGKWLVGETMTWADLYVYPILADLKSIPEGPKLLATTLLLQAWVDRMEGTPIARATVQGTVADLRQSGKAGKA